MALSTHALLGIEVTRASHQCSCSCSCGSLDKSYVPKPSNAESSAAKCVMRRARNDSRIRCRISRPCTRDILEYRVAHSFCNRGQKALAPRAQFSEVFAVDIHPAAGLGKSILRGHGTRVVIGETAVIGDRLSMLQGITLAGPGRATVLASVSELDEAPKKYKQLILKPPLSDGNLAERFLSSPQLQVKAFPLLSSCLPIVDLNRLDQEWIDEYLLEAKDALGYSIEILEAPQDSPASHLDSLLFLAFQHKFSKRGRTKLVGIGHSRLAFLGQFVVELAFAEMLLQMYPRERVGSLRERVFNLTNKKVLPKWFYNASMNEILFPSEETEQLKKDERQTAARSVFWAVVAATYLCLGMPEVYRLFFEVFGLDLEAPEAQPKLRVGLPDEDILSPDLEKKLTWQEVAACKASEDSLFSSPRLFRACVPPGMHRFRGNEWEILSLPKVLEVLEYPRPVKDRLPEITEARNIELELGLQLCFLHPSKYKGDHPRFCFDRLEYMGQKIQDVILAENLLMKHLDGPAIWLERKHRAQLMNRLCGRTLREKNLTWHITYDEERRELFEKNRRLRNFATTSVQHAIHGLGYLVYGRGEVRRLMSKVFPADHLVSPNYL